MSLPLEDPLYQSYVPISFKWPYSADEVYVAGDWNEFRLTSDHRLVQESPSKANSSSTPVFKLTLLLLPGIHRYKFYVNNSWEIDPKKPVTRGGMSNLLVVGSPVNLRLTHKFAGDVASEEWDLVGWKLNETWFLSSIMAVLGNCRSKLKTLKIEDMKSINGKLLIAVLQGQALPQDFSRQLTIAPELYTSCHAGDFVSLLFESMMQMGDKENLNDFVFHNIRKTFASCSKCNFTGEMAAQTSVFMLNISKQSQGLTLEQQVLENLNVEEKCPKCSQGTCQVNVSFETMPRFFLLNTNGFYSESQLSPTWAIKNVQASEKHIYDMIGACNVTANTFHQAIWRKSPGRWYLSIEDEVVHLPSWEMAAKRIAFGKSTFFVYERQDIRRVKTSANTSAVASPAETPSTPVPQAATTTAP